MPFYAVSSLESYSGPLAIQTSARCYASLPYRLTRGRLDLRFIRIIQLLLVASQFPEAIHRLGDPAHCVRCSTIVRPRIAPFFEFSTADVSFLIISCLIQGSRSKISSLASLPLIRVAPSRLRFALQQSTCLDSRSASLGGNQPQQQKSSIMHWQPLQNHSHHFGL